MCTEIGCGYKNSDKPLPQATDKQRRMFLKGLAALPLAVVLADPKLAAAAGHKMPTVEVKLPDGSLATADIALPANPDKAPTVLLIHEWWGLNDQIRAVANELAEQGYIALAVDLYDGQYGGTPQEAMALMRALDPQRATDTLVAWVDWLRNHERSNGKVATMGWCFGGGWSLNASLAAPVDATVIYYGNVEKSSEQLASLNSPVLGHFGTLDKNINKEMVDGFEASLKSAGKSNYTLHWYEADHAFANPSSARYDEADAALAWTRTTQFLADTLS